MKSWVKKKKNRFDSLATQTRIVVHTKCHLLIFNTAEFSHYFSIYTCKKEYD
jgi:hypothetical protein